MIDARPRLEPGRPLSTRALSRAAATVFADGPLLLRTLQRWRPYICPFDRLIEAVPDGAVLDIGCGGGLFLGLLHEAGRLGSGLGFDSSGAAIDVARAMVARVGTDAIVFEHHAVEDPWPEGTWDVVSLVDVMHHVPGPAQRTVIEMAAKRVRPGGRLVYKDMVRRPRWRALANRLHDLVLARQWIRYVPVEDVEAWAGAAGLEIEQSERIDMLWYGHELRVFTRGDDR